MNAVRPWLYIGKFRETLEECMLSAYKITAMLQLAEAVQQPGITSLYLPVDDSAILPEYLRQGVDFIRAQKRLGRVILVACGAGRSRSVGFAVAALKEEENISLLEALKGIKTCHPEAEPNPTLWKSLCEYYREPVSIHEMVKIAWNS